MQQETKFKAATAKIAQVGSMFANAGGLELNFDEVTALLRSHIRTIAYSTASCLALALIYLLITPAQYTATALLLIDTRSNILQTQQVRATDANAESAHVETQVEVLRSERIARAVIASEELTKYPMFAETKGVMAWLRGAGATTSTNVGDKVQSENDVPASAVKEFQSRLAIKRNAQTHIIEISFRYPDPKLAAKTTNAVASTYLTEQLRQRDEIIRSTSQWLKVRAVELQTEAHAAETALLRFRNTGNTNDVAGRSVLRDLEVTAQTYRLFSENFQKRFLETSQSGTYNLADARVVSEAWPPLNKSHPKSLLTLAIAGAAGLSIGFLLSLLFGKANKAA